ncbi:MAG: toxin-antitoxin system YwqK family antitoxin [Fluviicola sp.]
MRLPKACLLIAFLFLLSGAHSQHDLSLKWLDLLENDWPDFEREDSKQAANKLITELKHEILKSPENAGRCNYLLCEINYYLKEYDSSIFYAHEAIRTNFRDSLFIYQNLSRCYQHKTYSEDSELSEGKEGVKMSVKLFNDTQQARNFFIIDQRNNYSMYFDKYSSDRMYCEGQFDPKSLDTVNFFYDTISLFAIERDGTVGILEQKFPVAKSGLWTYYYENGVVQMSGHYLGNKRNGEWIFYDPTGEIDVVRQYKMGEIVKDKILNYYIVPDK